METLHADLAKLADTLCERRALRALCEFLPGYLGLNGLTDGWGGLEKALKDVLVFSRDELTEEDREVVKRLMIIVQGIVYGHRQ